MVLPVLKVSKVNVVLLGLKGRKVQGDWPVIQASVVLQALKALKVHAGLRVSRACPVHEGLQVQKDPKVRGVPQVPTVSQVVALPTSISKTANSSSPTRTVR